MQVPATVVDGGGHLVKGLGLQDFRIYENDRPQPISHFIGVDGERELVVAVDMSGSMVPAMTTCREAVKRFLATVRPVDHATLLAFNDSVFTVARRDATPPRGSRRSIGCARGAARPSTTRCCGGSSCSRAIAGAARS